MTKGNSTKEFIIEKSSELFNIYGYHGCALSDIMEATSLKKGGIYNHFKNKDEIAVEAFNYNLNKVKQRFRTATAKASTSKGKLYAILDAFSSFTEDPIVKGGGCPIFNTAMDATNTHPELKKKAKEGIHVLQRYIEIKLEEGVARGEFKPSIDVHDLSSLIICTLEGAIIMSRVSPEHDSIDIARTHLKQHLQTFVLSHPTTQHNKKP